MSKVPLREIKVEWYEGYRIDSYGDSPTFQTWREFQIFLRAVYDARKDDPHGTYSKVKVRIEWRDGKTLVDRVDVGNADWRPGREIGHHIRGQNQAMYESDFQFKRDEETGEITDRERDEYAWDDTEEEVILSARGGTRSPYPLGEERRDAYRQGFLAGIAFIQWWQPSVFEEESDTLDPERKKLLINASYRETDEWAERELGK